MGPHPGGPAPFTGAGFLRNAELGNVVNLRASYHQEAEAMVARLTEDLGITRVAVMYQNDSHGQSGLDGVVAALAKRSLEPVAFWYYRHSARLTRRRPMPAICSAICSVVQNGQSKTGGTTGAGRWLAVRWPCAGTLRTASSSTGTRRWCSSRAAHDAPVALRGEIKRATPELTSGS